MAIPITLQPGRYRLLVGLYDPATGGRVGGRALELAEITVLPPVKR